MNILVTGATGYVGYHLCKELKKLEHNVVEFNSKNFHYLIEKYYQPPTIKNVKFDIIYHLAVKTEAGGYCQKHPGEQFLINSEINNTILKYWYNYQSQAKFITMGSSCGYDDNIIRTEDNYLKGQPETGYEVYGNIKRNLLIGLRALHNEYGMNYSYLIPSTIYGPYYKLNDKHFIYDLIQKIYSGVYDDKEVILWGTGDQRRELIYIDDVIRSLIYAMENEVEICNLSSGFDFSIKDYAKFICDIMGYDFNKIKFDTTQFVGALNKKMESKLSPRIFTPLYEGLQKTIEYYKNVI
jgi:GDP-L-fucose synthase